MQYASNCLDLSKTSELDLSDRGIIRANSEILRNMENLIYLDLCGNKLNELWEHALYNLPNLKKLKVDTGLED